MMNIENLDELIKMALAEDIGDGDHSTLACIPPTAENAAKMVAKQEGVLCGAEVGERVFHLVDSTLKVNMLKHIKLLHLSMIKILKNLKKNLLN